MKTLLSNLKKWWENKEVTKNVHSKHQRGKTMQDVNWRCKVGEFESSEWVSLGWGVTTEPKSEDFVSYVPDFLDSDEPTEWPRVGSGLHVGASSEKYNFTHWIIAE